jgi:glycosyltransferase involved in cell wall biosynthesis
LIANCSHRPRIAFIFNYITPYRVTFFEKLCTCPDYEWLVIHGTKVKNDGRPAYQGPINFPNRRLKFVELKAGPFSIRWHKGIMKSIREWKPDVVITLGIPSILTNWLAITWAHRYGAKTITWHSGWESQSSNKFILPIKHFILKKYLSSVDSILVYSTKGSTYLSSLDNRLAKKITICYNGLEISTLSNNEDAYLNKAKLLRDQLQLNNKKIFLYVGGIALEKQVSLLLKAFQQLSNQENLILWIVGDGPGLPEIQKMVEILKLGQVKIWGRVTKDVDVIFAAADYFILPGIGGLALNQALFWKLPCVVSEADGTEKDLVFENQTGFYFAPNDFNSLHFAMEKCLGLSDQQRVDFGNAGRNLILHRSNVDKMIETFVSKIFDVLNEDNSSSSESNK